VQLQKFECSLLKLELAHHAEHRVVSMIRIQLCGETINTVLHKLFFVTYFLQEAGTVRSVYWLLRAGCPGFDSQ